MKLIASIFLSLNWSSVAAQALVLPGDYPDPSVVRIGDSYWATATTSNWAPAFPLLQSKDLVNWDLRGHVFQDLPSWADYYYWAPEISIDKGKVYVYYAAHKRDGNLCLAVASADKPEGPYTDHGPIMCQPAGSIDAFAMRDNMGKLYMIWKEDGNSVKEPTPIWAMEMNEARTELVGEKEELFRNDAQWEANLVEGVSMIRHGDYLYAFYAGAGCCGRDCSYEMGVARAKDLLGPWEKYDKNPLFRSDEQWKCPGHGTPVEKDGRYYLLYHGYHADDGVYVGRQGLLKEFGFTDDGWISLIKNDPQKQVIPYKTYDEFNGSSLSPRWQWSVFQSPQYETRNGKLELKAMPGVSGAFLGQKILTADFKATTTLFPEQSKAESGLAIVGDEKNMIGLTVIRNKISLWKLQDSEIHIIKEQTISIIGNISIQAVVRNGKDIDFFYSANGEDFQKFNVNVVDGAYLPPWDRAIRVAVIARGSATTTALFDNFVLEKY